MNGWIVRRSGTIETTLKFVSATLGRALRPQNLSCQRPNDGIQQRSLP